MQELTPETDTLTLTAGRDYQRGGYEYHVMLCTNGANDEWEIVAHEGGFKSSTAAKREGRKAFALASTVPTRRDLYVTALEARGLARGMWPNHGWGLQTIMRKLGNESPAFLLRADDSVQRYHGGRVETFKAGTPEARAHWAEARAQRA